MRWIVLAALLGAAACAPSRPDGGIGGTGAPAGSGAPVACGFSNPCE